MNRLIILIAALALAACPGAKAGETLPSSETLRYDIVYHWGLIWKHAGSATLSIRRSGETYDAMLAARTISWADKIYRVRDTLSCSIRQDGLRPTRYRKASHEGKHHGTDIVEYTYSPDGTTRAVCRRIRPKRETQLTELQTDGQAYDMLSIFYYLRCLDFASMKPGTTRKSVIFSGRKKESLTIHLVGQERIKLRDKSTHDAYHVTFTFTQDGQSKSSDDMHTWLSTAPGHTPLMMKGKLPIGEVRCYLSSHMP